MPLARHYVRKSTEALRARLRRLVALAAAGEDGGPPASDAAAVELEKRRGPAGEAVGELTDRLAGSAKRVLGETARAVAASWSCGQDGAAAARSTIVSAAGAALAAVREAVDGVRAHAGDGADAEGRRLPPLFDPEFLDAIRDLPPPRVLPGVLTGSRAESAVEPLLPFLVEAFRRYASRLRAWGEGALRELRPAGRKGSAPDRRAPELAGLEALIAQVGVAAAALPPAGLGTSDDASEGSHHPAQETTGGSSC